MHPRTTPDAGSVVAFGDYELDLAAGELRRLGRSMRLQPQPFKLLVLLVSRAGNIVTRDEIRHELWKEDTFVDFDQGVNFCIRQIRDALRDDAEQPIFVQTVPKRGYRFIAPVQRQALVDPPRRTGGDTKLMRALWTNIAEIRLADQRRRDYKRNLIIGGAVAAIVAIGVFAVVWLM